MPIFDTIDEVNAYILTVTIPEVTEVVSELGKEVLNEMVEKTVYNEPSVAWGKQYKNTFGLRDNANSQISTYGKANVASRVHLFINPDGDYPSFYLDKGSLNNNNKIVEWLDYRKRGGWYKGWKMKPPNHRFFEKTAQKLLSGGLLKKTVQDKLKSLGYVISRTLTSGGE